MAEAVCPKWRDAGPDRLLIENRTVALYKYGLPIDSTPFPFYNGLKF